MDYKIQIEKGITGFGIFFFPFLPQFNQIFCRPSSVLMSLLCATATNANTTEVHTLCKAAKRTDQRGHTFPTGPELRQRSILQTVANVRRRKLQVFTDPGEWKGSTSLLYDQTSPISDGIQFTPPERGSLFNPPHPRAGQLTLTTTRKIRLAVAVYRDGLLNKHCSQFTVSAAAFGRAFHPYLLTVARSGLLFLQFGVWCRFRGLGTGSVRGERLR